MNGHLYISKCPLANCHWESAPVEQQDAASEAFRGHLAGHPHADLVLHIHATGLAVTQYVRSGE